MNNFTWIIPSLITVCSFVCAWYPLRNETPSKGDYAAFGNATLVLALFGLYAGATIVSLISWLIWSLL